MLSRRWEQRKLGDDDDVSSQPHHVHQQVSSSGHVCMEVCKLGKERERAWAIENEVEGQRLSEIYPQFEACKREDAGSWGPEIRAQTWAISTQTPVREASAPRLRPTLTGDNKTQPGKEEKDTITERSAAVISFSFPKGEKKRSVHCRGCVSTVAHMKGEKKPILFYSMLNGIWREPTASFVRSAARQDWQKWCCLSHDMSEPSASVISPGNGMAFSPPSLTTVLLPLFSFTIPRSPFRAQGQTDKHKTIWKRSRKDLGDAWQSGSKQERKDS